MRGSSAIRIDAARKALVIPAIPSPALERNLLFGGANIPEGHAGACGGFHNARDACRAVARESSEWTDAGDRRGCGRRARGTQSEGDFAGSTGTSTQRVVPDCPGKSASRARTMYGSAEVMSGDRPVLIAVAS